MPLIKFICNNSKCNNSISKVYRNHKDIPQLIDCDKCNLGKLERTLGVPSSKSTQIIDNGIQARKVEVLNSVIEKETERLDND